MDDYLDISEYLITEHVRKRWRKRWLDHTPRGGRRIKSIEEAVKSKMKVIKEYPERGTLRVTDYNYEFIVDIELRRIITMNAYKKVTTKDQYLKSKQRRIDDEDEISFI